jgi:preprotein translocase subunit YajC
MPQAQAVNPLASPIFLFPILLLLFYFIVLRPQKGQEKERQKMLNNLNKNDEVVTSFGIHGTIVNIKDKTVVLRIDDNVKIEMEKNSVAYVKKTQAVNQGA